MTSIRIVLVALVTAGTLSIPARAHSVLIYSGQITWEGTELRLTIDFDAHLLDHERRAFGGVIEFDRLAREMASCFRVQDDQGRQAVAMLRENLTDGLRATLIYRVAEDAEGLAIAFEPTDALAGLQRQFQFRRAGRSSTVHSLVRLTSGMNHAVLLREEPDGDDALVVDRFSGPVIGFSTDEIPELHIAVDLPCYLLPSWTGQTLNQAVVSTDWLQHHRDALVRWAESSLICTDEVGNVIPEIVESMCLVLANDREVSASTHALGVYTTRIRMKIKLATQLHNSKGFITWHGFNYAVLRTYVTLSGNSENPPFELTPTQNMLQFDFSNDRHLALQRPTESFNAFTKAHSGVIHER